MGGGFVSRLCATGIAPVAGFRDREERAVSVCKQVGGALEQALQAGLPVVACSGGSQYSQELGEGRALPADTKNWYVNAHCYTALAYDGNRPTVTLRNPWARFPEPDGVFTLPVKTFVPAFRGIITTE